ncbi:MAG: MFS transporter [Gammaproteobacteria bacterium]|nr:MFS transporter [Gammaproteobacteria bacterium]NNM01753.1 MFS transporter [Gammaproteobacteria bacterium]
MPGADRARPLLLRRQVLAWALYDWANSAFATTVMAGFFPVFFGALITDMDALQAQAWYTRTITVSSLAVAIMAPVLGAIADRGGSRKRFLATFAWLGILSTAALAWVAAGQWGVGLALYGLGTLGFSGANIFYDSMLCDVADRQEMDLVSTYGFSAGYLGGGLLFAVNVAMTLKPGWFGLADAAAAVRASFVSVAVWWALFSLPVLIFVREQAPAAPVSGLTAARAGWRQLKSTLSDLRDIRVVLTFLVGYWLYIDGVNTVIKMAVFFGDTVLKLDQGSLIAALLLTQFVAFPAALAFGWAGQRVGAKRAILAGLAVYIGLLIYAWRWLDSTGGFYGLAVGVGLIQGGVQGLSRSLFGQLIPLSKSAEFFGLFNMVGKFAAIIGPLLMGGVPLLTGNPRDGILAVAVLFIIGGAILTRVDMAEGRRCADRLEENGQP